MASSGRHRVRPLSGGLSLALHDARHGSSAAPRIRQLERELVTRVDSFRDEYPDHAFDPRLYVSR
jgi:hypothetical protein